MSSHKIVISNLLNENGLKCYFREGGYEIVYGKRGESLFLNLENILQLHEHLSLYINIKEGEGVKCGYCGESIPESLLEFDDIEEINFKGPSQWYCSDECFFEAENSEDI